MKRMFIFLVIIMNFSIITGCQSMDTKENHTTLTGEIVLANPDEKGADAGSMVILNLKNNKKLYFSNKRYYYPNFNDEGDKIIAIDRDNISGYSVTEYSIKNNNINTVYEFVDKDRILADVRYVPNSNNISFLKLNGDQMNYVLNLYNIQTKQDTTLIDLDEGYCWNENGEDILYSLRGKIYIYDIKAQKSEYLFDGFSPEYSNNAQYVAYLKQSIVDGGENTLIVKDIVNNKEFKKKITRVRSYKFSPDSLSINFIKEGTEALAFTKYEMLNWNFKNDDTFVVIDKVNSDEFDWK